MALRNDYGPGDKWKSADANDAANRIIAVESGGRTAVTQEAPLNIEWPEYANLRVVNGISAGVDDWTPAFVAAQAALPDHVSGKGGGTILLPGTRGTPEGFYSVSAAIEMTSGQNLMGVGQHRPIIQRDANGPVITTRTDGGADPLESYIELKDLYIRNPNAGAAASALKINQVSRFTLNRVVGQAMGVGGKIAHFNAVIVSVVNDSLFGGAGGASCDHALFMENNSNETRLINSSFIDARNGIYNQTAGGFVVSGCHVENLNGTIPAIGRGGVSMSGIRGGIIIGNYFESLNHPGIVFYSGINFNRGIVVGGNFMVNTANPGIDCAGLTQSTILPNYFSPGSNAPNMNGVLATAVGSVDNVIFPQHLASGTGVQISMTGGGRNIALEQARFRSQQAAVSDQAYTATITGEAWDRLRILADGTIQRGLGAANPSAGAIDKVGNGTPEGVVTAPVGSTYHRMDGGAGTCLYVKESGTGNTGWVAK